MSNEAQGLVRNLPMSSPHKPILMAYANYADEAGYCWPSVETIAFDTGFSVPTVVRVRRDLIAGGWLRSKRKFGSSATTRLNLPKIAAAGIDRGDRTKIIPELEFGTDPDTDPEPPTRPTGDCGRGPATAGRARRAAPIPAPAPDASPTGVEGESAGHARRDQADLNAGSGAARSDQTDLHVQIPVICSYRSQGSSIPQEPSGDLSLDARAHADSVGDRVPDRSERASETAPPNPRPADPAPVTVAAETTPPAPETGDEPEAEAAAWALDLIGGLDYGAHRRPTRARATALALKLGVAHAGGLSQRDLRRHCRAALNQARRNGVAYLDGALDPDHLPIPTRPAPSPAPTSTTPAAPASATTAVTGAVPGAVTGAGLDRPSGSPATATMSRAQAQAEIRRILTRRRPATSPEMAADAQTGPAAA